MFVAFPGQIPTFSEKTFRCLILSQAIVRDNLWHVQQTLLCWIVGVDLLILPCIDIQ